MLRRVLWHPGTAAVAITAVAVPAVVAALLTGGAHWLWPWLLVGVTAGFATSGST